MKNFLIEPTYKKSVIETDIWKNANGDILELETGWRWGEFMIDVPETEAEITQMLEGRGYDSLEDFLEDRNSETLEQALLPNTADDCIDLTEDYDADLLYTDDGCWMFFKVRSQTLTESECIELQDKLEEIFEEDFYSGLEDAGWETVDTLYYIDCPVTVDPCDERGKRL